MKSATGEVKCAFVILIARENGLENSPERAADWRR